MIAGHLAGLSSLLRETRFIRLCIAVLDGSGCSVARGQTRGSGHTVAGSLHMHTLGVVDQPRLVHITTHDGRERIRACQGVHSLTIPTALAG